MRGELDQPRRELDAGLVREPEHRRVGDAVELVAHGLVEGRVAVAVDVAPQRRDAVDVGAAVGVDQVGALRGGDDDRRLLVLPAALLGERVPEDAAVEGGELGGIHGGGR